MAKKKDDTLYFILGAAVLGGIIYYSMNAQPAPPAAAATATTNQNNGQTQTNSNTQGNNPGAVSNLLDSGVNDLQSYITDNSDQSELYDQANNDYSDNSGDGSGDSMSGKKRPMSYQRALKYEM